MNRTIGIAVSSLAVVALPATGMALTKKPVKPIKPVVKVRTIVGPPIAAANDRHDWGPVTATIVVKGKKIINVKISSPHGKEESDQINSQADPLLTSEALKIQSARVTILSEATLTSEAFARSMQAALIKAGLAK
jgi:uncharacterized protein with FMN-binding domain